MVKYTTPLPWIGLSESDSKLCPNFEFCEGKDHKQLKNTLTYKAKQFMLTKKIKKSLNILEDGACSVQVYKLYSTCNYINFV